MIEIFEGRIGGGKTYSAVERMAQYVSNGGACWTNVEINLEGFRALCWKRYGWEVQPGQMNVLSDEQMAVFHRHSPSGVPGKPSLVVVDEAHLWFNSRDWCHTSKELLTFLTQSRKVHTDVIFISQSVNNIDKQFMRLVQWVWTFRDLSTWKPKGLFGIRWPLPQILQCQWDYASTAKEPVKRYFKWKDKMIFGAYNTFSLLREFPRLQGARVQFESVRRRMIPEWALTVAKVLVVLFAVGIPCGCRFVSVTDIRKKNLDQDKVLQRILAELGQIRASITSAPAPAAVSRPVGMVPCVQTNEPPRVSAVVSVDGSTRIYVADRPEPIRLNSAVGTWTVDRVRSDGVVWRDERGRYAFSDL